MELFKMSEELKEIKETQNEKDKKIKMEMLRSYRDRRSPIKKKEIVAE